MLAADEDCRAGISRTGQRVFSMTRVGTLPKGSCSRRSAPPRPCVAITIKSARSSSAKARIVRAGPEPPSRTFVAVFAESSRGDAASGIIALVKGILQSAGLKAAVQVKSRAAIKSFI